MVGGTSMLSEDGDIKVLSSTSSLLLADNGATGMIPWLGPE